MTNLTGGLIGFYLEDTGIGGGGTYGTRLRNGTVANTVVYAFGEHFGGFMIPTETPTFIDRNVFSSFDVGDQKEGAKQVNIELNYMLMEGLELYFPLGKEAKSGSTPNITHVLTGIEPSDGNTLPSRTVHIESTGLTTQKVIDVAGCISESIEISGAKDQVGILVKEKLIGQRITDENATTDLAGVASATDEDDAKVQVAPAYADNTGLTVEDFYYLKTIKHETNDITEWYEGWTIKITNEMIPRRANRAGTDNRNRTINNYVGDWYLKKRRYLVTLLLQANDDTKVIWDRMYQGTEDNTLEFVFHRNRASDANEDVITWTFHATIAPVKELSGMVTLTNANDQSWHIVLQPKNLTNCTVVDDVNEYQELHE